MRKYFFFFLLSVAFLPPLFSQQELGLHFMDSLWQRQKTNPAFLSSPKVIIGLPSIYSSLSLPASYNSIVTITDDNRKIIDGDKLINQAKDDNTVFIYREVETFSIGIPLGSFSFALSHAAKEYKYWNFTKNTLTLAWQGNANFVGQTVPLYVDMHTLYYHELALGLNKNWGKLQTGLKIKLLAGAGDLSSEKTNISLSTNDDIYQLQLHTDYRLNTAGRLMADSLQNIRFSVVPYKIEDAFSKNPGWALDFGINYQISPRFSLSISVLDIGKIHWKEQVNNFSSNGKFNFNGLTFDNLLQLDSFNVRQILDTINTIFAFDENNDAYYTTLPAKFYMSSHFKINKSLNLSLLAYSELLRGKLFQSIAAGLRFRFTSWVALGCSYAWRNNRFDNIGINATIKLGPFQLYGATDTFLAPIAPLDAVNGNTRVGMNLLF
jgi:hypothetical protein